MAMVSTLDLLRRVPFFSLLPESTAQAIASVIVKQRFRKGQILTKQGEVCQGFYIIVSGSARVITADDRGREVILATLRAGDYLGEMSLIDDNPTSATIRFETQSDVLCIPALEFKRYLPLSGSVADGIMRGLAGRLRQADYKIQMLALMSVHERVKQALREVAVERDGELYINSRLSRQDMAKMVGASREMVSRVMRDLEKEGFYETATTGELRIVDKQEADER